MEKISRKDARAAGILRYFTGKPCVRGHVAERYVNGTDCVQCNRDNARRKYQQNPDHYRAKSRAESARNYPRERAAKAPERARRRAARKAALEARRAAEADRRRERTRENQRAWRLANPGYHRDWRHANPDKWREMKRGRKVRKRAELIIDLTKLQRGKCAYCRILLTAANRHVDHIQPRHRGGGNARRNLQLACDTCNVRKSAKDPIAFAQELGRLL